MSFIAPLSLLLALLAIPIILMYMLRLRRREVVVSSTFLWEKLVRDREANAPWQKLKRNLLLILQLLILGLLVFALARPFIPVPSVVNRSVVVLLDGSASMQATDVEPSRFEQAKGEVNTLIRALSGNNRMTLIQVGPTPRILATASNDKRELLDIVEAAQPSQTVADWPAAFALAAGAAQGFEDARIIVISDGGLPSDLPALTADLLYISVGISSENLAISALATRGSNQTVELFTSVTNAGLEDQTALVSITIDDMLFDVRSITVAAGQTVNLSWQLLDEPAIIQAELSEQTADFLALDDRAYTVHEGGVSNRTLLVTEGNLFLEQMYAVLPGISAFKAAPGTDLLAEDVDPFDLYVFDGVAVPDPPPAADMLIVNPVENPDAGDSGLIQVGGIVTGTQNTAAIRLANTPLLQFVDWGGINVRQFKTVDMAWTQTLVDARGGPLLLIGEQNGHRVAIITFDLQQSDLPLQIAFPILMANLTNWLSPGRAFDTPDNLRPGDVIPIVPNATANSVSITKPDSSIWQAEFSDEGLLFIETDELGLYQVSLIDATGEQAAGQFAINLFSPAESQIIPLGSVLIGSAPLPSESDTLAEENLGRREFWVWLAITAFAILIIEWWIYHQGQRWPNLRAISPTQLLARFRKQ